MSLDFIGIDPGTPEGGSPTVWLETETEEFIFQGVTADARLYGRIGGVQWVPGHELGIPAHESVVRLPVRMLPILREACDAAERAGLFHPADGDSGDVHP
jgi:hypothetical protein